ncbi:MAG: hypothetical protein GQ532_00410 [Methylomarinum sp.]|nr:hypothetical protein [Methylomarinum sp.]
MPDNESFTYHVKNSQVEQVKSAETSLITLERAQKLDLLIHLIANLRQSLVICGPYGIGKTVLLSELRVRKSDVWPMVTIRAESNLSFESIQDQLLRFLMQNYSEYKNQELSSILSLLGKQNQKIVVVIDDAGLLVPGLITSLIQYAGASECLRVIFALTHDELHIKSSSDRVIDDCHFIEIPPLTEKQCGIFLQNMSSQSDAVVSFNAINDKMVAQLYRETHGIPGKIMSELPKLSNYNAVGRSKLGGAVLLAAIVAVAASYFISDQSSQKIEQEHVILPLLMENPEVIDISTPVIESVRLGEGVREAYNQIDKSNVESALAVESTDVIAAEVIKKAEEEPRQTEEKKSIPLVAANIVKENSVSKQNISAEFEPKQEPVVDAIMTVTPLKDKIVVPDAKDVVKPASKPIPKKLAPKKEESIKKDDSQWVLKQAKRNYTIQLIVLSQRKSIAEFMNNNKQLKEGLKYFQINKQGQTKFVLIYGSFKNAKIASEKMKLLPAKYRKSWVRRFKNLQREIK